MRPLILFAALLAPRLVDEHGFDKADAYQVVSQVAVVRVANVVDPL
jgi:hypothetical protein